MIDTICFLCDALVYASPMPKTWGIDWVTNTGKTIWVHYKCANDLFEAIKRMEGAEEFSVASNDESNK